jgi:hypothetical protein
MTLILSGSDGVTFPDSTEQETGYANGIGFRNRIINGDMMIDQRNAGASVTLSASGVYPVDRFIGFEDTDGAMTAQQDTSAPTGFVNSVKFTTTTADATLGATQFALCRQIIEGTNVADLGWGTASAKTVTLSFWVRSSLTGTFGGALGNGGFNRSYPFTYSISVADTWEYKTITITGDTSGTWLTTTGIGIRVNFGLGTGSGYAGTAGAWAGAGYLGATGETSVIGTLNATWYITGVQLEVGSVATPFERRPYGTELVLCQRYYWKFAGTGTANQYAALGAGVCTSTTTGRAVLQYPVQMRTAPTFSYSGNIYFEDGSGGHAVSAIATSFPNLQSAFVDLTTTGLTLGRGVATFTGNLTTDYFQASSEL